jgi:hypothetical protein
MTYGATSGLTIDDCRVESSTVSDITMGLAAGATNMQLINSAFLTPADCMGYYTTVDGVDLLLQDCTFAGRVVLSRVSGARLIGNTFSRSLYFSGGPGSQDIVVERGVFLNWPGSGIDLSGANISVLDLQVIDSQFNGTGDLTYGIQIGFNSARRLVAKGNTFSGATIAGISIGNGGGLAVLANVASNTFTQGRGGIVCASQGIQNGVIDANTFTDISGWCIDFANIGAGYNLDSMQITNNLSGAKVTNGLRIAVTSGTFDNTVLTGNDFHSCSGVKWSVAQGNVHGRSANNVVE